MISIEKELYEKSYQNPKHFSFGKNWQDFLRSLNDERIANAEQSLICFLGNKTDIANKTFIDIGCGSGLFSLAAYRLGAKRVVSVDIDEFSLACTRHLRNMAGNPEHWEIYSGSALNREFLCSLGTFDVVYSWGVLHHTGDMYQALKNIVILAGDSAKLYVALYNDNQKFFEGKASFWLSIKKKYNQSPWLGKKMMQIVYTLYCVFGLAVNGLNPFVYIKNYQSLRGMNFLTDVKDWLGGYPYEFATAEKIISYFKVLGFVAVKVNPARSIGCNEFIFMKKDDVRGR